MASDGSILNQTPAGQGPGRFGHRRIEAPDITAAALAGRGWNRDDLVLFFETGASPQGSAFGDMFVAIKNSLRLLTHDDRVAIATYLMDTEGNAPSKGLAAVAALGDKARMRTHPDRRFICPTARFATARTDRASSRPCRGLPATRRLPSRTASI